MLEIITLLLAGVIASLIAPEYLTAYGLSGSFGYVVGSTTYVVCLMADYLWSRSRGIETRQSIFSAPIWRAWIYAFFCSMGIAPYVAEWDFWFIGGAVFLGSLILGGVLLSIEVSVRNWLYKIEKTRQRKNWR